MYETWTLRTAQMAANKIKRAPFFPVKTGNLRDNGVVVSLSPASNKMVARADIVFDNVLVPYIAPLEEGSKPHDIPNAFGWGMEFGIGGRFDGKFHPGSVIHKGFISRDAYSLACQVVSERASRRFVLIREGFAK